jgi:hydrogenase/urease accessory protein HupE
MSMDSQIRPIAYVLRFTMLALFLMTTPVFAHDPGLSAVELRFQGDALEARLSFSRAELESLGRIDADHDGQATKAELDAAGERLRAIGREAVEIKIDERLLTADEIHVSADDSNAIHFDLSFKNAAGSHIAFRSKLIEKLALGHKQYLTLKGATDQSGASRMLDAKNPVFESSLAGISEKQGSFWGFLLLGVEHILIGFDHIAFLLALLLAGGSLREAAKIITSFTAAHSLTLALATLNIVNLPSSIVEPLIAVSIIYVGLENIFRPQARRRWLLTFGFGLIHGFGFASVLRELGVGSGTGAIVPLASFNLGVEIGQIAIAALVLPLIWKLREQPRFAFRYVPAFSILIASLGGYWLVERTLF